MGYIKIIIYGNNIEIYEYEKTVVIVHRDKQRREDPSDDKNMGINGQNLLQERKLGKRQDNARRASLDFRRLVGANLGSDSRQFTRPILATLTYRDNFTDLKGAYRHLSSFIQSLRHKYGKIFKYTCVPEFQERGAVHFHALFWGLPEEIFLREREDRTIAGYWRHGFIFLKQTDGNEKLSFYLSKYMAKAFLDARLKNQKCYVASRNILRPVTYKGASASVVLEDYGINIDTGVPVEDRSFDTTWLGKGRFRLFKIPDKENSST